MYFNYPEKVACGPQKDIFSHFVEYKKIVKFFEKCPPFSKNYWGQGHIGTIYCLTGPK